MKILVVEDDPNVIRTLNILLSSYNYAVDVATDGEAGLEMADAFEYDLVVLDILLPKLDGISLCQKLRAKGFQMPILLLTAQDERQQKVVALNAGADDYVVKPFDLEELIARIQALLRRGNSFTQPILKWGNLQLDPSRQKANYGTHLLSLTPKEYAILELFLRHNQRVFSARAILDHAWNSIESPGEEAVRAHIKELRHKLKVVGAPQDFIKTVYRVGYQLNPVYSSLLASQGNKRPAVSLMAELTSVNEELRIALEELQIVETELRQQNEALRIAHDTLELERQRYQDLFEFAPDGYLVTDIQGIIQAANHAALGLLAVDYQYLIGKRLVLFIAQTDRKAFRRQLARLNLPPDCEVKLQPRKGKFFPVIIAMTTIKNLQNEVIGLRWSLRDIRDRKQMEQQLRKAHDRLERLVAERTTELIQANRSLLQREQQWEALFDRALDAIAITDDEGYYLEVNSAACELFGVSRQKFLSLRVTDFAAPESDIAQIWQQFLQQGQMCGEICLHRPDGGVRETQFAAIANFIPHRHLSILRDISDRKQLERALQASEAKLKDILNYAIAAIVSFRVFADRTWEYQFFSAGCEIVFGYTPQQLMADKFLWKSRVVSEDWQTVILPAFESFFAEQRVTIEYRFYHADGSLRWVSDTYTSRRNETADCWIVTTVAIDISDRQRAEEAKN